MARKNIWNYLDQLTERLLIGSSSSFCFKRKSTKLFSRRSIYGSFQAAEERSDFPSRSKQNFGVQLCSTVAHLVAQKYPHTPGYVWMQSLFERTWVLCSKMYKKYSTSVATIIYAHSSGVYVRQWFSKYHRSMTPGMQPLLKLKLSFSDATAREAQST